MSWDINKALNVDPATVVPLVGLDSLPEGFLFRVNLSGFGQRGFAIVDGEFLEQWFQVAIGDICELMMHEYIFQQVNYGQISLCSSGDDLADYLPMLVAHGVRFEPFGGVV